MSSRTSTSLINPLQFEGLIGLTALGRYSLAGLIERFGADAAGPDVLMELAQCERRKDFSRPCGARFTDLAART
jgi:hypothetical protein